MTKVKNMPIIDVILVVILAGFVFYGLFFGLIRTLGAFVGLLVAAFLASRLYLPVSVWVNSFFFGYANLGKVLVFVLLFSLINRLVSFLFYLLHSGFNLISIIPFLKTFNRLGGVVLGFLTGSLSIGLFLYFVSRYSVIEHWFGQWLSQSEFAPFFLKFANALLPLLPEILKKLQSLY
ncbi:MAG: Colicin V production protein [Candidatus Falkowbacteria bacterium GW2011_GWC2_38_22]|uniref:Colicin V production protein n=1 Tax=Candidatus Falkowbacteria bacterium GW2011_GWE1_38_31 TaxID=1618638 RepID=A0A0G0N0X6_9BACT|nr:MAG: Colicin V production protein [Candidatus Falkowbacteria bacterium GW2011_GWF2_38_1205]KKQ61937.1 MAG: Colicin V production protein [Candidatus Falkowbacteria bacterium GW2011_GWC2_38_22]KKQ63901.1 MAG: Colicin V production protein [Candidatus Falkowbacteria bacterium GW2011_GWF1_38_22]KKQ66158.1 MAG: Colicin V production protein [Candidatus Falkowbacteria bacterium GW2011_GWE2_38_254]KKQ70761.1 MAG: Colicin V production protein [Candidatus Falkowbacteria bacterium GW2011_GWE1_38_31]KKQ